MTPDLPAGYRLRPGSPDDARAVTDLAIAVDVAEIGEPDYELADAQAEIAEDGARHLALLDEAGRLRGWIWTAYLMAHEHVELQVLLHPDEDAALGPLLVEVGVGLASQVDPTRAVQMFVPVTAPVRTAWPPAAGFSVVRRFSKMRIDMADDAPAVPAPPTGVDVHVVGDDEQRWRQLHHVMDEAFAEHYDYVRSGFDDYAQSTRGRAGYDPTKMWLVTLDGAPVAGLVGRTLEDMGWVGSVGTLPVARGRGLGRLLLLTAFDAFHRAGHRRVGLGVDAANVTSALRLYESVGMTAYTAADLWLRPPDPAAPGDRVRDANAALATETSLTQG